MTTKVWLVERGREVDLANLDDDDYRYVTSLHGQIRGDDQPLLLCMAIFDPANPNSDPAVASLYVKQWRKNRKYYASHFRGCGHGEHAISKMSDAHRRQTDYFARAAEDGGFITHREMATDKKTCMDLAIEGGPVKTNIEVQWSDLTVAKAKGRTTKTISAGWLPVWFSAKENDPAWFNRVPSLSTSLKTDWNVLPPVGSATATGLSVVVPTRCRPGEFQKCPKGNKFFCGEWHYKLEPWRGLTVDDVAQMIPNGLIVPARIGRGDYVRLVSPESKKLLEELTFPGAGNYKSDQPPVQMRNEKQAMTYGCRNDHVPIVRPEPELTEAIYRCQRCGDFIHRLEALAFNLCQRCRSLVDRRHDPRSVTRTVPIAASVARHRSPHIPPERICPECGSTPPAGHVRCPQCRRKT